MTPRPISSSGLNATLSGPCGTSGRRDEVGGGGHDLGDAGLVVGAEERRAVGRDHLVADVARELRRLVRPDDVAGVAERDVAS